MKPRYRPIAVGACTEALVEHRADGCVVLRATEPLGTYPSHLGECLAHWASTTPDRLLAAQRGSDGAWRQISYADMLGRARSLGQALLDRGLSAERPLVILSDNDLEHLSLMLGAMWAGIPTCSLSPAYSLVSSDHGRLRHIIAKVTPGAVYAANKGFARAIHAVLPDDVRVIFGEGEIEGRASERFADLLATHPGHGVDAAHAGLSPDTIVKFMFTSGSTKAPKGVIVTQRMWCANQQMTLQAMRFLAEQPPVVLDWLPWNHTFGGNHNLGIVLYNGGSLYIDEGKPVAGRFDATLRNLRDVAPTVFFNVPKGFDELVTALQGDAGLRDHFFSRLQMVECGGAGLSQKTLDAFNLLAEAAVGERIRLAAGLGKTETAPTCTFAIPDDARAGFIGCPLPGVDVKLVPEGDKMEVRFRGPNVMPGYWRDPELTQQAFDDEGYYRTGDAVRPADPDNLARGLMFDGRIAEDFKLSTGTFVSVGPLRARVIALGFPCVQDVVVTGLDRDEIGLMVVPRVNEARRLAGLSETAAINEVLGHRAVRSFFQTLADQLWAQGSGSANRPARMLLLAEPPSIDHGELTDKGTLNQRAMLNHRAALVNWLHEAPIGHPELILPRHTQP